MLLLQRKYSFCQADEVLAGPEAQARRARGSAGLRLLMQLLQRKYSFRRADEVLVPPQAEVLPGQKRKPDEDEDLLG